jgi:hypothetical protein
MNGKNSSKVLHWHYEWKAQGKPRKHFELTFHILSSRASGKREKEERAKRNKAKTFFIIKFSCFFPPSPLVLSVLALFAAAKARCPR